MNSLQNQYDEIYNNYFDKIVRYLSRSVGSEDAADMAQDVFIKVFDSLHRFDDRSSISTWVYRIATNHLIDKMRKRTIKVDRCNITDKELFSKTEVNYLSEEFRIVQNEMNECICSYIKLLPSNYRTIIVLREYENMPLDEISIIMDLKKENTKKMLYRARKKLRAILDKQCEFYYNELNYLSCEKK
jgi:RNA polymerase sigma-70 factor (ECF subfamily)